MQTQTLLIKHFETGKCPQFATSTSDLLRILGDWWYSVLYMDIDIHAQIRQRRMDLNITLEWIKGGVLVPYICRADGCGQKFGRFSSLVHHLESGECEWTADRLRLNMLEKEVRRNLREAGLL